MKSFPKKKTETDVAQMAQRDFADHAVQCAVPGSNENVMKDKERHSKRFTDIAMQCDAEESASKQTADAATTMTETESDIKTSNKASTEVLQLI